MEITSVDALVHAISQIFPNEVSIAISDKDKFIYYRPSENIDLKIKPGDDIKEGTLTLMALKDRKKVTMYVDDHIFGIPYFATSSPIIQNGDTEGCITAIYPPYQGREQQRLPRHLFLIGKAEDRWIPIPLNEINLIESEKGKTLLYTATGVYINKYTLIELESMLPPDQFIRCHRAYIVNVNAIGEIHPDFHSTFVLVMKDKKLSRVPVSQKYSSRFRKLMGF